MNKVSIVFLTLATVSASAGVLENRNSGETITFNLNGESRELEIVSTSTQVENQRIELKAVKRDNSDINLFSGASVVAEWNEEQSAAVILAPIALGYDFVLLPFKSTVKIIKNNTHRKDHNLLLKAITTDGTVKVSSGRFNRIGKLLSNK